MISRSGILLGVLAALALPPGATAASKTQAKPKTQPVSTETPASAAPQRKPAAVERPKLQPEKHKLKKGAEGQLCLDCHAQIQRELAKASVHTPLKAKQCTGCHDPHASQHGKLLAAELGATCLSCHGNIVPAKARSAHAPAANGECAACHAPHASANANVLTKPVGALCAGCHEPVAKAASAARVKHRPVEQGNCATCHDAHGSAAAPALLKRQEPDLCLTCHKADRPIFAKQHLEYSVAKSRCTSCHDPHGSSTKGMLYDNVHAPVAKGMCGQCHEPPGSPAGFKPKQHPRELCARCHSTTVAAMMNKGHLHRPVVDGDACLNCHDPHASRQKALLDDRTPVLCGTCHADTAKRHQRSPTKHQPVAEGDCSKCHDPHASDNSLLFVKASVTDTCGQCHDYEKHSTHPIGEKLRDPRNRNLSVQCLSCHLAHGTEYKRLMPFAQTPDLCVKCHEKYKR